MSDKKIFLPQHSRYIEEDTLISKIATFIFVTTSNETSTGNWCTTGEEIAEGLQIPYLFVIRHVKEIEEELWGMFGDDLIADLEVYDQDDDVCFDVNLWHCAIAGFIQDDACYMSSAEVGEGEE